MKAGIFWLIILDYLESYGLLRDPVSKKQAEGSQGVTPEFVLLPPYIDTLTHRHTHTKMTDRQKDRQMHICVQGHEKSRA